MVVGFVEPEAAAVERSAVGAFMVADAFASSVVAGASASFVVAGASASAVVSLAGDASLTELLLPSGAPTSSFAACVKKYVDTGAGPVCAMWKGRRLGSAVGSLRTSQVEWMERDMEMVGRRRLSRCPSSPDWAGG